MNAIEEALREDRRVKRLLNNPNWEFAAEAAINYFVYGTPVPSGTGAEKTRTWAQVKMVYDELVAKR